MTEEGLGTEALLPVENEHENDACSDARRRVGLKTSKGLKNAVAPLPKGAYRRLLQRVRDVHVDAGGRDAPAPAPAPAPSIAESEGAFLAAAGEAAAVVAATTTAASAASSSSGPGGAVVLKFSLPAGCFATALLREVTHNDAFI